jgi:hypothetical protein
MARACTGGRGGECTRANYGAASTSPGGNQRSHPGLRATFAPHQMRTARAYRAHICTRNWTRPRPCRSLTGTGLTRPTSALGLVSSAQQRANLQSRPSTERDAAQRPYEASSFGGGHVGVRSLAAGSALRCPRFVGIHVLLQLESEVDEARMARSQLERSAHVHNTQRYFGIGRRN